MTQQQFNSLVALWIVTIIGFWFIITALNGQYKLLVNSIDRINVLEKEIPENTLNNSKLESEIYSYMMQFNARIKKLNEKLYEKEIKEAKNVIEKWWFNQYQCSFDDIVDNYLSKIIFHCSFSDNDIWYLSINTKSNTIVKHKNK